ncbi:MAG: crossover junction endodeoxyribonuclease RuvC [bacterium]|nr:crossover junction endodeoxyribonuclease RuvC [bacterium]
MDPGVAKLGFAIINQDLSIAEAGIIKLQLESKTKEAKRLEQYQRMQDIYDFFANLLTQYPEISIISMEKYFFTHTNRSNAEFVFGVRGVLLMLATQQGKEIREYTPIQLKKNVT